MVKYLSLKNLFTNSNIKHTEITRNVIRKKKKCHRLQMRSSIVTIINNLREKKKC